MNQTKWNKQIVQKNRFVAQNRRRKSSRRRKYKTTSNDRLALNDDALIIILRSRSEKKASIISVTICVRVLRVLFGIYLGMPLSRFFLISLACSCCCSVSFQVTLLSLQFLSASHLLQKRAHCTLILKQGAPFWNIFPEVQPIFFNSCSFEPSFPVFQTFFSCSLTTQ